ncbi:MAG: hypothetical protein E6Q51_01735 [Methylophilus methylotrophus]|uniref:Uncharacterized protein n=1 Tax=Methylophilus methylotrophus TaxID=17 RepID=A0A5C7WMR9_METME|nr:MAG: hypothetical protein E6Q51_01735 [Methylophilus methylotrophus]
MANRYENYKVIARFELGVKPGQIWAVSTFKQKLTEIQAKFSGSYEERTALVLTELQHLIIEEIILESDPTKKLIAKGADNVRLQLIATESVTDEELTERKLDVISKVRSVNFLRNLLADKHLTYDQLERMILSSSDPAFLKQVIRNQEMPYIVAYVDEQAFEIKSFKIPEDWMEEGIITLTDYEVKKVGRDGTAVLSVPESEMGNKHIGDDRFVLIKVEKETLEYRTLICAESMGVRVSVDLAKMRKAKKQCPYYKLLKLHDMGQLLERARSEVVELQEKLSFL